VAIPFPVSPFPQDRCTEALKLASGLQVQWLEDAEPQPGMREGTEHAWLEVSFQNGDDIGWDERRTELDTTTNPPTQRAITLGRRQGVLSLDAYSLIPKKLRAYDILERVRFGWSRDVVLAVLQPIVAVRWCERIVTFPKYARDGRVMGRAHMDCNIGYIIAADTLDPAAANFVLSVNGGKMLPYVLKP